VVSARARLVMNPAGLSGACSMRRVHFQELECSSARTMISENLPRRPHGTCHIVSLRYSGLGDRRDTLTNNYRGAA
jgi:hypothetical protein